MSQPLPLTGILAEIAEVAGEAAALAIARERGGTQIYIPPRPADDHWICALIGIEAARAVCDQLTGGYGPRREVVPQGPMARQFQLRAGDRQMRDQMILAGRSERDIALATGYTVRSVRKRRAQMGKPVDTRQLAFL